MDSSKSPAIQDAQAIWKAGIAAVDSRQLVREFVSVTPDELRFGDTPSSWTHLIVWLSWEAVKPVAGWRRDLSKPSVKSFLCKKNSLAASMYPTINGPKPTRSKSFAADRRD